MQFLDAFKNLPQEIILPEELAHRYFTFHNSKYKYFLPDDDYSFRLFYDIYRTYHAVLEISRYRNNVDYEESLLLYKILVLFGKDNIENTLASFDNFQHQYTLKGDDINTFLYNNYYNIDLPICTEYAKPYYNFLAWKAKLPEFGYKVLEHFTDLSKIEKHLGKIPDTYQEFEEALPKALYKRAGEDLGAAKILVTLGAQEINFNIALDRQKQGKYTSSDANFPNIVIDIAEEARKKWKPQPKTDGTGVEFRLENGYTHDIKENLDEFNNKYYIKLPASDPRYNILRDFPFNNLVHPSSPESYSTYILIKTRGDATFDPSMDWDELTSGKYELLDIFSLYNGPNGNTYIARPHIGENESYANYLIMDKILEIMPNLDLIMEAWDFDYGPLTSFSKTYVSRIKKIK
ncbi:MAG UNVERIFIED_CONTAM: hypothetical protein LVQ98_06810 [Rickettsiaceae bacterium]|jgi:hypothetical protein